MSEAVDSGLEKLSFKTDEIIYRGHRIELLTEEGAIDFSEEHKKSAEKVLDFYWDIDPNIVKGVIQLISENKDEEGEDGFPLNGENGPICGGKEHTFGAIRFTKRGMSLDIAHRVSSTDKKGEPGFVDNFSGTVAHEFGHGGSVDSKPYPAGFIKDIDLQKQFYLDWQRKFGWKHRLEGEAKKRVVFYTTMPEKCIGGEGGYAAHNPSEDICDSMAAMALSPSILHEEKRDFINGQLSAYKAFVNSAKETS